MVGFIKAFASLLRTLLTLALVGLIGYGGWVGYHEYYLPSIHLRQELEAKQAEVERLGEKLEEQQLEIERLGTSLRLLKVDHRVAKMTVMDQWRRPEDQVLMTRVLFGEVDARGELLEGYKTFDIEGDIVYVDAWVAKFMDEYVEQGVPLRSTTLCLFRRLFGEHQSPSLGFPLDAPGSRPAVYSRGEEVSPLERDIWANFWEYANNPAQSRKVGLRALHGEAPSIRLDPSKMYWILLRASDGLTIKATDKQPRPVVNTPAANRVEQAGYERPATQ